jgi:hypothetical protein
MRLFERLTDPEEIASGSDSLEAGGGSITEVSEPPEHGRAEERT